MRTILRRLENGLERKSKRPRLVGDLEARKFMENWTTFPLATFLILGIVFAIIGCHVLRDAMFAKIARILRQSGLENVISLDLFYWSCVFFTVLSFLSIPINAAALLQVTNGAYNDDGWFLWFGLHYFMGACLVLTLFLAPFSGLFYWTIRLMKMYALTFRVDLPWNA